MILKPDRVSTSLKSHIYFQFSACCWSLSVAKFIHMNGSALLISVGPHWPVLFFSAEYEEKKTPQIN